MPIIGLTFKSMEAKRDKGKVKGEIKVNSVPKITDVREVKVSNLGKKALALDFEFVTKYKPKIGEARIDGEIVYMAKKNKDILKKWKKKKKLPENISIEVLNHIFRRCLVKVANLTDDLQLPPPLQMPRVKPSGQSADYVG